MDKYEYNLKLEEIDKLVDQGDYKEAANLADTIEWKRVRNTRTLSLISEIYEAAGRLPDSKKILERAYRKTPVGRHVLYRLVEVTTALQQYDEALEYYTEYVQAAPHDNNRYILKYKLYRGRGSSTEELIGILEEYLGQEYTERWAYELAKLYRDAGQMQKCYAACDDLVLWFHSGKYVRKALELKKKYTALTPKQQQVYEECLQEEAEIRLEQENEAEEEKENEAATVPSELENVDGEVIAEQIIAATEKEIAEQVSARKAEIEQQGAAKEPEAVPEPTRQFSGKDPRKKDHAAEETEPAQRMEAAAAGEAFGTESGITVSGSEKTEIPNSESAEVSDQTVQISEEELAKRAEEEAARQEELQLNMARSMREIVSGVVKRQEIPEEDMPASVENRPKMTQKVAVPDVVIPTAGKLSIDDILLSMGEKGKEYAAKAAEAGKEQEEKSRNAENAAKEADEAADTGMENKADSGQLSETDNEPENPVVRTVSEAAVEELTEVQREALQYTSNPEKLLRNKRALPSYSKEPEAKPEDSAIFKDETAVHESSTFGQEKAVSGLENETVVQEEELSAPEEEAFVTEEKLSEPEEEAIVAEEELSEPEEEAFASEKELSASEEGTIDPKEEVSEFEQEISESEESAREERNAAETAEDIDEDTETDAAEDEEYYDDYDYMTIPDHLRGLFSGFTEIPDLEDQIANAIILAESRGEDRTSKTGNILIFGAHESGKTTLAVNLAKAIAQDRGSKVVKMAKIFAADLNKKDIASTIAKIAGGTLIIEEAGDLEDDIVEQLTTAMEFRTDGLVIILEDEQRYVHELLMRHPRFTMKFTAQIYIPEYTVEELAMFGQTYANEQDYMISEDGMDLICEKISSLAEIKSNDGEPVTIKDVIDMVARAIERSNGFFRKIAMGKKRYDENDYIILFAKDFK